MRMLWININPSDQISVLASDRFYTQCVEKYACFLIISWASTDRFSDFKTDFQVNYICKNHDDFHLTLNKLLRYVVTCKTWTFKNAADIQLLSMQAVDAF